MFPSDKLRETLRGLLVTTNRVDYQPTVWVLCTTCLQRLLKIMKRHSA